MKRTWTNCLGSSGMKYGLTSILILMLSPLTFSQSRDWIRYEGRKTNYPSSIFFTGFMSINFSKGSDLEDMKARVLQQAKAELSENIRISIESNISNKMTNINSVSLEEFEKVSTSYSSIDIAQLHTDVFINAKKKEIMAFAWVKRQKVIEYYIDQLEHNIQKLKELYSLGTQQIVQNQNEALKTFHSASAHFRKIDEAQAILVICGIDEPKTLKNQKTHALKLDIDKKIDSIKSNKNLSVSELSSFLATTLKLQVEKIEKEIQVQNITYRESGMGSDFSERFSHLLMKDLAKEGFQVGKGQNSSIPIEFQVSGTYWEDDNDRIQVIITLIKKGKDENETLVAGTEGWTTTDFLVRSNLSYRPSNYFQAYEKKKIFSGGDIANGGAKLELWTNKGDNGLIYREGEKLRVSIRVNKVGYVRLLNYWADGTQLLLMENYYVGHNKVNRVIELPMEWNVACPCGVEFIQANSQSIAFVPLDTKEVDGFSYVTNPVNDIISTNKNQSKLIISSGGFSVEERLILTTLE